MFVVVKYYRVPSEILFLVIYLFSLLAYHFFYDIGEKLQINFINLINEIASIVRINFQLVATCTRLNVHLQI